MTALAVTLLLGAVLLGALAWQQPGSWHRYTVAASAAAACAFLLEGAWQAAVLPLAVVAWLIGGDWWNRKGRRAAKALGLKSRALVDGLARRMRGAGRAPGAVPA